MTERPEEPYVYVSYHSDVCIGADDDDNEIRGPGFLSDLYIAGEVLDFLPDDAYDDALPATVESWSAIVSKAIKWGQGRGYRVPEHSDVEWWKHQGDIFIPMERSNG